MDSALDNLTELIAEVAGRAFPEQVEDYLLVESVRQADPDTLHLPADAIDAGEKDALDAIAREAGVMPPAGPDPIDGWLDDLDGPAGDDGGDQ